MDFSSNPTESCALYPAPAVRSRAERQRDRPRWGLHPAGAISLAYDAAHLEVVYAALWHHQAAFPPEPADIDQAGCAICKSTDGGQTC